MSSSVGGQVSEEGCALSKLGCIAERKKHSVTLCNQCTRTPYANIQDVLKGRPVAEEKRASAVEKYKRDLGAPHVCAMLCKEYVDEPWVQEVIKAKIRHQAASMSEEERSRLQNWDSIGKQAKRQLTCQGAQGPKMLCYMRRIAVAQCDKNEVKRMVEKDLEKFDDDCVVKPDEVVQYEGLKRLI